MSSTSKKVTPSDVTELEREQLRFLLSGRDMAQALVELNPSLSWLPTLYEMNLLKDDTAVAVWVEQNFDSTDAVREVVANIRFFREESADILELRLNRKQNELPALLVKCWQLIIRHIRNARHDFPYREWFEILPRLKKGEHSTELLERFVIAVTPRLRVEKRFGWYDREEEREITEPSDLMTVRYEVDDLAAHTGLRMGDLLRLSWSHVGDDAIIVSTGKSRHRRTAIIPLYDALRQLLARIPKHATTVLTNSRRRPWKVNGFGTAVNRAKINAGMGESNLHFHDLRGTAVTRFYVAGLSERVIAEIMAWEEEHVAKIIRRYVDRTAATRALIRQLNERRT